MKKVSVILTCYNGSDTIEETIHSILQQEGIGKVFTIELIVVDDCSTDNTIQILESLNIPFLSTPLNTGGPNKGRNMGLEKATGDYLCIADQDDIWKPQKLKTLLPFLDKVPVVTSGYEVMDNSTQKKHLRVKKSSKSFLYFNKDETFKTKISKTWSAQNTYLGSIIYRKELRNIKFEETFGVVDYDWVCRLFHKNDSIEVCDSLYIRKVENDNLSLNEEYRKKDFFHSLYFIENYFDAYPKEVKIAYKKIHGTRARYYYMKGEMNKARFYFRKSQFNLKTLMYILTTFGGSSFVKKHFNVFG